MRRCIVNIIKIYTERKSNLFLPMIITNDHAVPFAAGSRLERDGTKTKHSDTVPSAYSPMLERERMILL